MSKIRIDIQAEGRSEQFSSHIQKVLQYILEKHINRDDIQAEGVTQRELDLLTYSLFVEFVDDEYMRAINKEQRNIDSTTDVLSFAATESMDGRIVFDKYDIDYNLNELFLGDILISENKVFSQAEQYGHSALRESVFLASHGLLHLLGYDHEDDQSDQLMIRLQNRFLEELGYER